MAQRRRGLGRGIGALIPESQQENRESPISVFFGGAVSRETGGDVLETEDDAVSDKGSSAQPVKRAVSRETPAPVSPKPDSLGSEGNGSVGIEGNGSDGSNDLVPVPGATYAELLVSSIIPNRKQPRTVFDDDELNELAESIREVGVLQPIIVRPLEAALAEHPDARYELIMGERRWRASERAEMETIPAIVRRTADEDLLRDALLENLHRAQLNPLEEAAAYQQLLDDFGCSQEELSKRIARSRPQISNTLRLLKLPPLVQRRVAAHVISAGHARALLGLSDPAAMERLAQRIVAEGLSVRQVEEIVAVGDEPSITPARQRRAKRYATELGELSARLADRFDTKVKVELGQHKGSIRIDFASIDDLNRILGVLAPEEDEVSVTD